MFSFLLLGGGGSEGGGVSYCKSRGGGGVQGGARGPGGCLRGFWGGGGAKGMLFSAETPTKRKTIATAGRSYGAPSEVCGGFWGEFSEVAP